MAAVSGRLTPDQAGQSVYRDNPTVLSLSTTTAKTAALAPGPYWLYATADCYWLTGPVASVTAGNAAGTDSIPLPAETYFPITLTESEADAVAGIVDSGTALLYVIRRGT